MSMARRHAWLRVVTLLSIIALAFTTGCTTGGGNSAKPEVEPYRIIDTAPRPYYFKVEAEGRELVVTREEIDSYDEGDAEIRFVIERDGFLAQGTLQYALFENYINDDGFVMQHELSFRWVESEYGDCSIVLGDEADELERFLGNISNHVALDVTRAVNMRHICSADNGYENLDLSNNPKLGYLGVGGNNLTYIDTSQNPELRGHNSPGNPYTHVDFSNNKKLLLFNADFCPNLTEVDLSMCPDLEELSFGNTPLKTLSIPWMERSFMVRKGSDFKDDGVDELIVHRFPGSQATIISRNTEITYVDDLK